jgi:hypothetical protein
VFGEEAFVTGRLTVVFFLGVCVFTNLKGAPPTFLCQYVVLIVDFISLIVERNQHNHH